MSVRERCDRRPGSEPPSGVHPRFGRVLVIEPDMSVRPKWNGIAEVHRVEFVHGPGTLPHALGRPGAPQAISVALMEKHALCRRAKLVSGLAALRLGGRLVVDVRRCDVATAVELVGAGYILCADDEHVHGTAPRAAVRRTTMADELSDADARTRLAKTLGATELADRHELSAGEYRVLRGLMDCDGPTALASVAALSPSTVRSHASRIRKRMNGVSLGEVVLAAHRRAMDAAFALGRLGA